MSKPIQHQDYYGGDNVYEVIKIIQHYKPSFEIGNVVKYVLRAGKKSKKTKLEDLKKARVYLDFEIKKYDNLPKKDGKAANE